MLYSCFHNKLILHSVNIFYASIYEIKLTKPLFTCFIKPTKKAFIIALTLVDPSTLACKFLMPITSQMVLIARWQTSPYPSGFLVTYILVHPNWVKKSWQTKNKNDINSIK